MCNCTCIGAGLSVAPASAQVRPENTKNIVTIKHEPQIGETPQRALDAWLTPNPHFYVRNHFSIPDIRCSTWSLSIDGLITRERRFTLQQLKRFPRVTLPVTMECAGNNRSDLDPPTPGNQFQNGAVSTAYWAGARLSEVLKSAGVRPNAREVLFEGHDIGNPEPGVSEMPYTRSLPIDVALHPDTLLAYEMNGQELPKEHGHPLRLIVPGWYGMASVKWPEETDGSRYPLLRILPRAQVRDRGRDRQLSPTNDDWREVSHRQADRRWNGLNGQGVCDRHGVVRPGAYSAR